MIANLQGVRYNKDYNPNDGAYVLTDPCLLSNTYGGKYGSTDTGIEGMAMFFLNHHCNQYCDNILRPYLDAVKQELLYKTAKKRENIGTSTAYLKDLIFPPYVRDDLIQEFNLTFES